MMTEMKECTDNVTQDTSVNMSEESYEDRVAYARGFRDSLNVVLEYLAEVDEKDLVKQLCDRYNEYVISKDCFGLTPSGGDAYKG